MLPGETQRCSIGGREVAVRSDGPLPDPCPFLARVDAHLRGELGAALGGLTRAERVLPGAYWRLFYPGALDGFVPLDLEAVTEDEVASGRARLFLDPRTRVLTAVPPPEGPGAWRRWQTRMGTPDRLVCRVEGAPVEVLLDLEFVPALRPDHLQLLLEGFLREVTAAVRWATGSDPGPLLRAEHGGTWSLAYGALDREVFAVCHGPDWRAVAEGRYRLEAFHMREVLDLGFFPP